jgi:hypothetical protein
MTTSTATAAIPAPAALTDTADRDAVRMRVRRTLERTPSFLALPQEDRKKIANDLVTVMSYLSDPAAGRPELEAVAQRVDGGPPATALDATEDLKQRMAKQPEQVGKGFVGGAAREGGAVMAQYQKDVDFVGFVSGLIHGVFESIVDTSIKQMKAYGQLLEAVVKSVNEFAHDEVGERAGRDYLASKFPDALKIDDAKGGKLTMKDGIEDNQIPDLKGFLGLKDDVDLEDEEQEKQAVEAAQLKMARLKQQQLATMVMLGINRIVVTEGEIKATVVFDVKSRDVAHREAGATMDDTQTHYDSKYDYQYKREKSFWGTSSSGSGSGSNEVNTRVSTAHADSKDSSDSKLDAQAKLTGFVQVKFKSETFPLERMASPTEMGVLQERAQK